MGYESNSKPSLPALSDGFYFRTGGKTSKKTNKHETECRSNYRKIGRKQEILF